MLVFYAIYHHFFRPGEKMYQIYLQIGHTVIYIQLNITNAYFLLGIILYFILLYLRFLSQDNNVIFWSFSYTKQSFFYIVEIDDTQNVIIIFVFVEYVDLCAFVSIFLK